MQALLTERANYLNFRHLFRLILLEGLVLGIEFHAVCLTQHLTLTDRNARL